MKKIFALLVLALFMAGCNQTTDFGGEIVQDIPTEPMATVGDTTFSVGVSVGNTYRNAFVGLQCALDDKWTLMTDEEIQMENISSLGIPAENYAQSIFSAPILYDMMANHGNGQDMVCVVLEKADAAKLQLTEEAYLAASKDSAVSGFESLGITVSSAEITKIQFADAEHYVLKIHGRFTGYNVYEYIVALKCDGYIAVVTACTLDTDTCMDVLNQFKAY